MTAVAQWVVLSSVTLTLDIGQYVATVCSAELHSCSYCCSQQEIGRPLVGRSIAAAGCRPFHHPILAIIPGSVSIHVSDVSLGNAANVSVGDRVPQDTNNVLCCAGVCSSAAALGAAVKMIKLIRPSSGRVAAWPSKQ